MELSTQRRRPFGVRRALVIAIALSLCVLAFVSVPRWTCCSLILDDLVLFGWDARFPVPPGCVTVNETLPGATLAAIEKERLLRRLEAGRITMCRTRQSAEAFWEDLLRNPQWFPSYVPGTWQYRRYVAIAATSETSAGTLVVVEMCKERRWHYYKHVLGNCEKYTMWR
jgi:hypothetical protein